MIAPKTVRFLLKYASSDPLGFADIVRRRAIEQFRTPPTGLATRRFNGVHYEIDMSLHRMMRKYLFHTHEMFLERVFKRCLAAGNTFIDIGANCGYWSAYSLSLVGQSGEVHAFEPVPQYFPLSNGSPNSIPTIGSSPTRLPAARGLAPSQWPLSHHAPRTSTITIPILGRVRLSPVSSTMPTNSRKISPLRLSPSIVMRERKIDLDRVGLIKIDVEGFEAEVFDGMQDVLAKGGRKVPILCEVLTDPDRPEPLDGRRIIERLEDCGYRCLDATHLRPINRYALGFEENILCL
ncbi:FkbM family methyltransferase [Bradyrhizobium sp. RDT10]